MSEQHDELSESTALRTLFDQALTRASGAHLVRGNSVELLRDARENYPSWLKAIESATRTIHFETYIIHEDRVGREFAERLASKAREGVKVRLIYDWYGALGHARRRFWKAMRSAGVEVRCFNPPRLDSPLGWLSRDHRKQIIVDGETAFVTGLCVGWRWEGDPQRNIEPWRDTGVVLRGPAVADCERAFAATWAATGSPLAESEQAPARVQPAAGDVALRVIASVPNTAGIYRLDQLIAAAARRSLWLTDAYFVASTLYLQALRSAARDGVDVRLLLPGASDIPPLRALSRTGYRPLLEAGVRVFEWNGPMLHAKTAVADGRWARVGSTNLNLASWIGNWELDVAVEDQRFARQMEEMYIEDLRSATEVLLTERRRVRSAEAERRPRRILRRGSASRAAAGAARIGHAVSAAMTNVRTLGPAETRLMLGVGLSAAALGVVAFLWPKALAYPLAVVAVWLGVSLVIGAYRVRRSAATAPEPPWRRWRRRLRGRGPRA
jgi:cardiolipin synthase